jgi:hypothetical protein
MRAESLILGSFMLVMFAVRALPAAENILTPEAAAQRVEIRNLEHQGNTISGEITNRSRHPLRNVELLVQYHWLWNNEFKPGDEPQGKAVYVTVEKELAPGESAKFSVPVEVPSGAHANGYYATEVTLSGFTEVIPQA